MELRPYQIQAKEAIQSQWASGVQKTLLVLPTGCHAKGERVLRADGTAAVVEDIQVGDLLLGSDGTSRRVLETHTGVDELVRVIPVKGEPFIVTAHHPLTLRRTNLKSNPKYPSQKPTAEYFEATINDIRGWSKYQRHIYKLVRCAGVEKFVRNKDSETAFAVDPYFLGILLGDGDLTGSINITTMDPQIVCEVERQAIVFNSHLRSVPAGKAQSYYFVSNNHPGRTGTKLRNALIQIGIYDKGAAQKTVPPAYKYADISLRLQVIAGLLDTDGSLCCNGYDFISASQQLSEDLAFMCRSVGLAAYVSESQKTCGEFNGQYWRVSISGECDKLPCRVKKAKPRKQKKNVLVTGFSFESLGSGKYYAFTVDGDHRYLLDDFTITHNTGKTIVFSKLAEDCVRDGERVLILAHRGELLDQAADKMSQATGLGCAVEKAESSCLDSWFRVIVGSVQSLMRETRLSRFPSDYFNTIIVDEAHHVLADSYLRVLDYFGDAKVLGVTATSDRGDMRNLGEYFETLAYEYSLPKAIRDGYLCKIKAQTIPLKLDLTGVGMQAGDYKTSDLGNALDPYLYQIADEMGKYCLDRKTVVFLPLIKTSQKFRDILQSKGFRAVEVNGESQDRAEVLADFDAGRYDVLCNSMLLTEGWDCPSVDCIVVLRPTKIRSLYCQMVGRGTRLHPGKDHLLLLDFLWHTTRHELCHPAHLICESPEVAEIMTKSMEDGQLVDIQEAEQQAAQDAVAAREESLAAALREMKHRKRKLVDPLQFEMSIQAEDLAGYVPAFGWECGPPSDKQLKTLEKLGIFPDEIDNAGKANKLLDRLSARRFEGLTTPRQIRFLEGRGFQHVGTWQFDSAKNLIDRIAGNGWRVPQGISPNSYKPEPIKDNDQWLWEVR